MIKEGVRIAHDNSWSCEVVRQVILHSHDILPRYDLLTRAGKEHAVNFDLVYRVSNPKMLPIKVLLKHKPHLIQSTKYAFKAAETRSPLLTASNRLYRRVSFLLELLD